MMTNFRTFLACKRQLIYNLTRKGDNLTKLINYLCFSTLACTFLLTWALFLRCLLKPNNSHYGCYMLFSLLLKPEKLALSPVFSTSLAAQPDTFGAAYLSPKSCIVAAALACLLNTEKLAPLTFLGLPGCTTQSGCFLGCLLSTKSWTLTSKFSFSLSALCNQKVSPLLFWHGKWLKYMFSLLFFSLCLYLRTK